MSSFRITMGMKMNTYRYNLMHSTNTLADSSQKVQTHRKFNTYAENPADATNAWRVRQDYMDNYSYQRENSDTYRRYQTAYLTMGAIKTNLDDALGRTSIIRGGNDASAAAKRELGGVLINTAETVIHSMNGAKYSDEFVFAGTNGTEAPFSWSESGDLLYRGINLTPPDYEGGWPMSWGTIGEDGLPVSLKFPDENNQNGTYQETYDAQGNLTLTDTSDPTNPTREVTGKEKEWYVYFKNMQSLNGICEEAQYSDVGMGMKEGDDGTMIGSTVFNNALPGIAMMGYGVDADGDPKSLPLLMKEIGQMLESTDEQGNFPGGEAEKDKFFRLFAKYEDASDGAIRQYTNISTRAKYLLSNQSTLEDQGDNLETQIADLEQVDMADAITGFLWDYSCYSAGLKIGTQLLSESLLDYMR